MAPNKTDANDADGLAQLAEIGYFKSVRVKSFDSMLTRTLITVRTRLVRMTVELSNQIRGIMKTFGLIVPAGQGNVFDQNVCSLLDDQDELATIILPVLAAWRSLRERTAELSRKLVADARRSEARKIQQEFEHIRKRYWASASGNEAISPPPAAISPTT